MVIFPYPGGGGRFVDISLFRELALGSIAKCKFPGEGNVTTFPSPEDTQGPDKESLLAALLAFFLIFHSSVIK